MYNIEKIIYLYSFLINFTYDKIKEKVDKGGIKYEPKSRFRSSL